MRLGARISWMFWALLFALGFGLGHWRKTEVSGSTEPAASRARAVAQDQAGANTLASHPGPQAAALMAEAEAELATASVSTRATDISQLQGDFSLEALAALAEEEERGALKAHYYLKAWARQDPAGLWAACRERGGFNLPGHKDHYLPRSGLSLSGVLFETWLEVDPPACLETLRQLPPAFASSIPVDDLARTLWKFDPQEAVAFLARHATDSHVRFHLDTLDEAAAWQRLELVQSLPAASPARQRLLLRFFSEAARHHPATANEMWASFDDATRIEAAKTAYVPESAPSFRDIRDLARAHAETSPAPGGAAAFIQHYGASWAQEDIAATLDWATRHVTGQARGKALAQILAAGLASQPEAAWAELERLPPGALRENVLPELAALANRQASHQPVSATGQPQPDQPVADFTTTAWFLRLPPEEQAWLQTKMPASETRR